MISEVAMDIDKVGAQKIKKASVSDEEENEEMKGPPPKSSASKRSY